MCGSINFVDGIEVVALALRVPLLLFVMVPGSPIAGCCGVVVMAAALLAAFR